MENREGQFLNIERLQQLHNSINILKIDEELPPFQWNDWISLDRKDSKLEESDEIIRLILSYKLSKNELNKKLEDVSQRYLNKSFYDKNEPKLVYFETEVDANDYLVELGDHQGESFQIGGDIYEISCNVTSFIRDYGYDNYSQMRTSIDELLQNGLIKMI